MRKILSILCLLLLLIPYAATTAEQKYYTIGELHDLIEEEYPNLSTTGNGNAGI